MMNMESRNQYLKELRTEYLKTNSKSERGLLLNEAVKRTNLNRKYLIEKLKAKSNIDKLISERKKRKQYYDSYVRVALSICWRIFDRPCGQRLKPLLEGEVDRLRKLGELNCSDNVAKKLKEISFRTIDEKLKHTKEVEREKHKYKFKANPLLYKQIPIKMFSEQNRDILGNIQIDLVEHCGSSVAGEYINTLTATCISSGWTEQIAVMGKSQENTKTGLEIERKDCPFLWKEIHSDGGTNFICNHLFRYADKTNLEFSRSRPYKKNDNCLVEQKNNTHVRRLVGYFRYDTIKEQNILNDLYRNELRLFKNFFQPTIKLVSKKRVGGKIHRVYDKPQTPYHRILLSKDFPQEKKLELIKIYNLLNPAELKRKIDKKLSLLYKEYKAKRNNNTQNSKVEISKKIKTSLVRKYIAHQEPVSVR